MVRSFMAAAFLRSARSSAAAQDRVRLEVYSTLEVENINDFKKAFEAENRDIEIVWIRNSTGVVTARILAEQSAQRGRRDLGPGRHLDAAARQARPARALRAQEPRRASSPPSAIPADPPAWVGMEALGRRGLLQYGGGRQARPGQAAILVRPHRPDASRASSPCRIRPRRGPATSMSRPGSRCSARPRPGNSWTGCTTTSPSTTIPARGPAGMAAAGEFPLGISYELAAASARQKGAPIEGLLMKEGGGWDMDAAAILRGTKKPRGGAPADGLRRDAARPTSSTPSFVSQVAMPGIASNIPDYPAGRRRIDDQERLRLGLGEPRAHPRRNGRAATRARRRRRTERARTARPIRFAGRPTSRCRSSQFDGKIKALDG